MTAHLAPDRQAPLVCDGCHANATDEPVPHHKGCTRVGVHMHHVTLPIEDCIYYQEWRGTLAPTTRPHTLYRFYNAADILLYIGITASLPKRLANHRDDKLWWTHVARISVEHYDDRNAVLAAERVAIAAEHPRWNRQHNASYARPLSEVVR